jgi:predicted XRE-type DNA-binding protein
MNRVRKGSGNVFRDLGLPDAELLQAKADLVHQITVILDRRELTQVRAAEILGINQPKISEMLHGRIEGFSLDRLARFLNALDHDVKISVHRKRGRRAVLKVA